MAAAALVVVRGDGTDLFKIDDVEAGRGDFVGDTEVVGREVNLVAVVLVANVEAVPLVLGLDAAVDAGAGLADATLEVFMNFN